MRKDWKEYLPLMFEFVISMTVIVVGAAMIIFAPENEAATAIGTSMISSAVVFWFQRRSSERQLEQMNQNTLDQTKATTEQIKAVTEPLKETVVTTTEVIKDSKAKPGE